MKDLESHPGVPLRHHLREVKGRIIRYVKKLPSLGNLEEVVRLMALGHDLGKTTKYFQEHLQRKKVKKYFSAHALLSSVLTVTHFAKELPLDQRLMVFLTIKSHHSYLKNIEQELSLKFLWEDLEKQVESIELDKLNSLLVEIGLPVIENSDLIPNYREFQLDFLWPMNDMVKKSNSLYLYFTTNLLLGMLVDADIRAVIGVEANAPRCELPDDMVDRYLENLEGDSPINPLRQEFYHTVIQNIPHACENTRIMSITAPTGIGKTLAGLSAALKLRNLVKKSEGYLPRIIYVLPYTSIIDQNHEVFESVLKYNNVSQEILIKHHHRTSPEIRDEVKVENIWEQLGEDATRIGEDYLKLYEKAYTRTETWDGEIIITTFVQFFETIFTNHRANMRRLHRLAGSIVIFDEVQNIPVRYWEATEKSLRYIADNWNTRIILMTATKPSLLHDAFELTRPKKQIFFQKLSRTNLYIEPETVLYTDIEKWLIPKIRDVNNFIVIMNTVKSAQWIYTGLKKLRKWDTMLKDFKLYFLSASLIPAHREGRIDEIKSLLEKGKKVGLIATQVVEAGIDIDFDVVIRDLAPMDSIVQAAGRCNRNGEKESGKVYLVVLQDERSDNIHPRLATYIYDGVIISLTESLLKDRGSLFEKEFLSLVEEYFEKLRNPQKPEESKKAQDVKIIEAIQYLDYETVKGFQLIEGLYHISVFVEYNEEARAIIKYLEKLENLMTKSYKDRMKKRTLFLAIKPKIWKFIVNVPIRVLEQVTIDKKLPYLSGFLHLPKDHPEFEKLYSEETGFVRIPEHGAIFL